MSADEHFAFLHELLMRASLQSRLSASARLVPTVGFCVQLPWTLSSGSARCLHRFSVSAMSCASACRQTSGDGSWRRMLQISSVVVTPENVHVEATQSTSPWMSCSPGTVPEQTALQN